MKGSLGQLWMAHGIGRGRCFFASGLACAQLTLGYGFCGVVRVLWLFWLAALLSMNAVSRSISALCLVWSVPVPKEGLGGLGVLLSVWCCESQKEGLGGLISAFCLGGESPSGFDLVGGAVGGSAFVWRHLLVEDCCGGISSVTTSFTSVVMFW